MIIRMRCQEPGLLVIQGRTWDEFCISQQVFPQLHLLSYNHQSGCLATFSLTVKWTLVLSSHFSQQLKISDTLSSLYSSRKDWDTEIILKIYVASYKLSITWSSKFVEMSTFADADALMANIPRFVQITLVTTDHLLEPSREQRRGDLSTIWRHSLPPARLSFC